MAEVAIPKYLFAEILRLMPNCGRRRSSGQRKALDCRAFHQKSRETRDALPCHDLLKMTISPETPLAFGGCRFNYVGPRRPLGGAAARAIKLRTCGHAHGQRHRRRELVGV